MSEKTYLCIDLKSFFASVECVERGLDPMTTNLVVADERRTEKTICLAVTPSLKALGIPGRARLFEVVQKVGLANGRRRKSCGELKEKSYNATELAKNPALEISYIVAPPRMAQYIAYSTKIYNIYLKYVAHGDIHVYSIDEVFMDITSYLKTSGLTAHEFAMTVIRDVLKTTGITATAGIGTNMYLAKIAMDVKAKKMKADSDGVRIAELDEMSYRRELWEHRPLTDFWRVGSGTARKLEANRLYTMGDIARYSLDKYGEDKLYKLFGINAELLIDHAWGWEPCTFDDIKEYKPDNKSISEGQVLHCPYDFEKARLIVREMVELLSLKLVEKGYATNQLTLTVGYDIENLTNPEISNYYNGEVTTDFYGRRVPKHAHGTANIGQHTASTMLMANAIMKLFDEIVDKNLLVRRINISANHIIDEEDIDDRPKFEQLDIFTDYDELQRKREQEKRALKKEKAIQETTLKLKNKFGKNAILKGFNLKEGATSIQRNKQIGGHSAGEDNDGEV
ncbi:MAG: DNA methylase [Clostridia bacterium]|nr:DNA methylase [Clostridia bacterium]